MHLHFSIDKTYSRFFNNYNCQLWPILSADNQNQAGFSQLWFEGKRTVAGLSLSGGGEVGADMEKVLKNSKDDNFQKMVMVMVVVIMVTVIM